MYVPQLLTIGFITEWIFNHSGTKYTTICGKWKWIAGDDDVTSQTFGMSWVYCVLLFFFPILLEWCVLSWKTRNEWYSIVFLSSKSEIRLCVWMCGYELYVIYSTGNKRPYVSHLCWFFLYGCSCDECMSHVNSIWLGSSNKLFKLIIIFVR